MIETTGFLDFHHDYVITKKEALQGRCKECLAKGHHGFLMSLWGGCIGIDWRYSVWLRCTKCGEETVANIADTQTLGQDVEIIERYGGIVRRSLLEALNDLRYRKCLVGRFVTDLPKSLSTPEPLLVLQEPDVAT